MVHEVVHEVVHELSPTLIERTLRLWQERNVSALRLLTQSINQAWLWGLSATRCRAQHPPTSTFPHKKVCAHPRGADPRGEP